MSISIVESVHTARRFLLCNRIDFIAVESDARSGKMVLCSLGLLWTIWIHIVIYLLKSCEVRCVVDTRQIISTAQKLFAKLPSNF